ncbi:MAG: hypothetical protein ABWY25_11745 [Paenisporosarcina sp.]
MTSNEVLLIIGESVKEIANLLTADLSQQEVLDTPSIETFNFHKGYTAALQDVADIIQRMTTKFGVESE